MMHGAAPLRHLQRIPENLIQQPSTKINFLSQNAPANS